VGKEEDRAGDIKSKINQEYGRVPQILKMDVKIKVKMKMKVMMKVMVMVKAVVPSLVKYVM